MDFGIDECLNSLLYRLSGKGHKSRNYIVAIEDQGKVWGRLKAIFTVFTLTPCLFTPK